MVEADRLVVFVTVVTALIAVPGPSVLFVVSRGVVLGRRAAVATAVGNEAGLLVQVVLVAVGLGTIVERSVVVFTVLKFAGALYLVYLGIQAWRQRTALAATAAVGQAVTATRRVFRDGFVVGATNPKGLLIFTAILPQFVDRSAGHVPLQMLVLGVASVTIALISDSSWGLLAGTARTWLGRSPRRMSAIGGASAVVMVALGVRLAASGRA